MTLACKRYMLQKKNGNFPWTRQQVEPLWAGTEMSKGWFFFLVCKG